MKNHFRVFLEDIFGLQAISNADDKLLNGLLNLLVQIRKTARGKKDFVLSDSIRDHLQKLGIQLKDEKSGEMSWTIGS